MMTPDSARLAIESGLKSITGDLPPASIVVVPDDTDPRYNWKIQVHAGGDALADDAALTHHQAIMDRFDAVREAHPIVDFGAA